MFWPPSIRIKYGFLFLVFIACHWAQGQNLGSIGKSNPLKISGGVSANQIFYAANGINARRNPTVISLAAM
jgi:hypothetical protein